MKSSDFEVIFLLYAFNHVINYRKFINEDNE